MSFTHTLTKRVAPGAGTQISKAIENTGGLEANLSESIAASQTNLQLNYALDVSAVKSFYMVASVDMLVETNSGGSPVDTINLRANEPYDWHVNAYNTFKFGTDITALFITNTLAGTLEIRCVVDVTP
jgi:hypothetical protein